MWMAILENGCVATSQEEQKEDKQSSVLKCPLRGRASQAKNNKLSSRGDETGHKSSLDIEFDCTEWNQTCLN